MARDAVALGVVDVRLRRIGIAAAGELQCFVIDEAPRPAGIGDGGVFAVRIEASNFADRNVETALSGRGDISILVNNAGTILRAAADDHPRVDRNCIQTFGAQRPLYNEQPTSFRGEPNYRI